MEKYTLYYYSSSSFNRYKGYAKKNGEEIFSLSELARNRNIAEDIYIHIDLTSAVQLLNANQSNLYHFELLLVELIEEFESQFSSFIIQEDVSNDALTLFKTLFDDSLCLNDILNIDSDQNTYEDVDEQNDNRKYITEISNEQINQLTIKLTENIIGHENFIENLIKKIRSFRVLNKINEQHILSIFLLGPSGIGKTEVAKQLHKFFQTDTPLAKVSFANYSSKDALNNLIGSPRGYLGSEEGELSLKFSRSNTGVILIDEFEKADNKVHNFFLELLEEGSYSDSQGEIHNLSKSIIVFTSNLDSNKFNEQIAPEFKSRLDLVVNFEKLSTETKYIYMVRRVSNLIKKMHFVEDSEELIISITSILEEKISNYDNIRTLDKLIKDVIVTEIETRDYLSK
ncbi:AAA domain-containing protein [Pontibacillus yanchengensis]|uniref:AAA domain-containing protein n=1 Tax=Pontibacillus yanchengensis TaxID=462910 RepID=A0A6I5A0S1_9BACI|nr:AAA family ATPase [Pontibacillus yanchengensis]MYL34976.1 AAA domain-containing protein [Pontibacillus yanchengensis]